jgi:GTPase SAR1 family protein
VEHKKIVKKESFAEEHPILIKILKCLGTGVAVWAGATGLYYGGRFVLDKINPDRVTERDNQEAAKCRLKAIDSELFDFELGSNKGITPERVRELREIKASLETRINSGNNFAGVNNIATGVAGVGGAVLMLEYGAKVVDAIGAFSKRIAYISWLRFSGDNFIEMYKYILERFKLPPKSPSKEDAIEKLGSIFKDFHGQDEATSVLKSHLYDIVVAKDQAKWKGEKYKRCDVIYLYGPSGVGKSFIAHRLSQILMQNSEPLVMSSSDVNKEKKESVVDQLFHSEKQQDSGNSGKIAPTKPLIEYLKNNPGGVVLFEEYDKICTEALDEVFRTAMEQGTINTDGEKTNCFGTTFIFTSNEDNISMEGFDKNDETKLDKHSLSEGYTRVWHSKSFLNRIKKVKFKNLTAPEYSEIIKNHFELIAAYWADENNGNIKLKISDETIKALSEEVEKINQGARPIDLWILPEIQMALGNKIKSAPDYDFYKGKSFNVNYDAATRKLQVC